MNRCCLCGLKADLHRGFCGYCLKDKGIQQALVRESDHWKEGALRAIRETATKHTTFSADEVKATAEAMNLPEPHHPNCWGGIFRRALSIGYMHQTGEFVASTRAKHHRQRIAQYATGPKVETEAAKWKRRAYATREAKRKYKKKLDDFAARGIV